LNQRSAQKKPLTPAEAATKWEPLLHGIDAPRTRLLTAWAIEQEARFLNSVAGADQKMGSWLRYILPAMRNTIPLLAEAPATFERVFETLWVVAEAIFEPDQQGCVVYEPVSTEDMRAFVAPLAERLHDYIVKFPG